MGKDPVLTFKLFTVERYTSALNFSYKTTNLSGGFGGVGGRGLGGEDSWWGFRGDVSW